MPGSRVARTQPNHRAAIVILAAGGAGFIGSTFVLDRNLRLLEGARTCRNQMDSHYSVRSTA